MRDQSIGSIILKWIPNRMLWGELNIYLAWDIGIDGHSNGYVGTLDVLYCAMQIPTPQHGISVPRCHFWFLSSQPLIGTVMDMLAL